MDLQQVVIIYSKRNDLIDAARQELKLAGYDAENFIIPENLEACMAQLELMMNGLILLDWDAGVPDIIQILSTNFDKFDSTVISAILFSNQVDEKIVACATEYSVRKVVIGSISREKIKTTLEELKSDLEAIDPVKESLEIVKQALQEGRLDEAIRLLQDQHQADTDNLRIRAELAEVYIENNEWQKAADVSDKFRDLGVPYPRGLQILGRCLMKLGKDAEAASVLQQAKIINPYNVERLVDLGNVLLKLDHIKEAEEQFDEALKFAPGSDAAKKGVGQCKLMEGDVNEALKLFSEISTDKELAAMFNTAAVLSIRHGRFDHGMSLYEAAIKVVENAPKIAARLHFNQGIGHYKQKAWSEALKSFQKAYTLDPEYADAKKNIAAISQGFAAIKSKTTQSTSQAAPSENSEYSSHSNPASTPDIPGIENAESIIGFDEPGIKSPLDQTGGMDTSDLLSTPDEEEEK